MEAKGSFKRHPERKALRGDIGPDGRVRPSARVPVGAPPKHFDKTQKAAWREFVNAAQPGVLNRSHRHLLETACQLTLKVRGGEAKASEIGLLIKTLSLMGMTPVDQNKIVSRQETPNEFAEFAPAGNKPN